MTRTALRKIEILVAACAVLFGGTASAVVIRFPAATIPDGPAVPVVLAAVKKGIRMCSRSSPAKVTSYWEVSRADVQRVDAALIEFLRNDRSKITLAYKPEKSVRQYIGFRRGTDEFIYVNAFPSDDLPRLKVDPSKELIDVCDGGDPFWGIEYDVKNRTFTRLGVNGGIWE